MKKKIISGLIAFSALLLPISEPAHAVPSKPPANGGEGGEGGEGGGEDGSNLLVVLGGTVIVIGGLGYLIGRRKK